jgi:predicted deacylase
VSWVRDLKQNSSAWICWPATPEATLDVFYVKGDSSGPLAVITAGVHGDEYEGPAALADVARELPSPDRIHGAVILIPVLNPLAFSAGTRTVPQDGLNLARTFPGSANGSEMPRLAHAVFQNLVSVADYVIDLHSGGVEYEFVPLTGFYGEARPGCASFDAARVFNLPTLWRLPHTGGVLSYEAWKCGKVAIGSEYLGGGRLSRDGCRNYREGVLRCLSFWSILRDHEPLPPGVQPAVFDGDWQLASFEGSFRAECELGQEVEEGALLASIADIRGEILESFHARAPGVVLGLRSKAWLKPGNWAVFIGKAVEITHA